MDLDNVELTILPHPEDEVVVKKELPEPTTPVPMAPPADPPAVARQLPIPPFPPIPSIRHTLPEPPPLLCQNAGMIDPKDIETTIKELSIALFASFVLGASTAGLIAYFSRRSVVDA